MTSESRLGVLLVETAFKLKRVFALALMLNFVFVVGGVLSTLFYGPVSGLFFVLVAFIADSVILLKVVRGFNYEELVNNG